MSRFTAVVESEYLPGVAEAISRALEADNESTPDTSVVTEWKGGMVTTRLESVSLEKLLSVLDDVLFCQSVAERTLSISGEGHQNSF